MRVLLSFCALAIAVISAFFLLNYKGRDNLQTSDQWIQTVNQETPNLPAVTKSEDTKAQSITENEYIHGQIVYDARLTLPPQTMLNIKLTEMKSSQVAATIAEVQLPLTDYSPQDWTLPVKLSSLAGNKAYTIQAKISSGDTLLFVTAEPTEIDHSRTTYIIRLAKIDSGITGTEVHSLIGTPWRAVSLLNKEIEKNSEISLNIDEETKTDPTGTSHSYWARGSGGCNRYMTAAVINDKDKSLSFTPPAAGLIACSPAVNNQEVNFIAIMGRVQTYKIDESGILYLLDEKQNALARFVAH